MGLAFDSVCEALGLRIREDPATRLVAEKVIELAQAASVTWISFAR